MILNLKKFLKRLELRVKQLELTWGWWWGSSTRWSITWTLSSQSDLWGVLSSKAPSSHQHNYDDIPWLQDDLNTILSTEQVQDIVGALFQSWSHSNVSVIYDDVNWSISISANPSATDEEIEDVVGWLITAQSWITASYDDANNIFLIGLSWISFTTADKNAISANTAKRSYPQADESKLAWIENNATGDQTDSEIETAYNNRVDVVSTSDAESWSSTTVFRRTPQRIKEAILALAPWWSWGSWVRWAITWTLSSQTDLRSELVSLNEKDSAQDTKALNLVENRSWALWDNTNFSTFTFDPTIAPIWASWSFTLTSWSTTKFNDILLPVNIGLVYTLSVKVKNITNDSQRHYFWIVCFDWNWYSMSPYFNMYDDWNWASLTRDFNYTNDAYIYLDKDPWRDLNTTLWYRLGFIFWNYVDPLWTPFPPKTYSRNICMWKMNQNPTIEWPDWWVYSWTWECRIATPNSPNLSSWWPDIPAWTRVSRCNSWSTYKYVASINQIASTDDWSYYEWQFWWVDTTWTNKTINLPPWCAYVKLLVLANRNATSSNWQATTAFAVPFCFADNRYTLTENVAWWWTRFSISKVLDDYVDLSTNQSVWGNKDFTDVITIWWLIRMVVSSWVSFFQSWTWAWNFSEIRFGKYWVTWFFMRLLSSWLQMWNWSSAWIWAIIDEFTTDETSTSDTKLMTAWAVSRALSVVWWWWVVLPYRENRLFTLAEISTWWTFTISTWKSSISLVKCTTRYATSTSRALLGIWVYDGTAYTYMEHEEISTWWREFSDRISHGAYNWWTHFYLTVQSISWWDVTFERTKTANPTFNTIAMWFEFY